VPLECAAAVAVVALGWFLLIKPAERSLADDRARVAAVRNQVEDAALTSSVDRIRPTPRDGRHHVAPDRRTRDFSLITLVRP
jgi:hypothetical protein